MDRLAGTEAAEEIAKQAEAPLKQIHELIGKVASEIHGHDYWRYSRAFSPGFQEYVESVTFLEFLRTNQLLTWSNVQQQLQTYMPQVQSVVNHI